VLQEEVSFFFNMFVRPFDCLFFSQLCVLFSHLNRTRLVTSSRPTTFDPQIAQKMHAKKSEEIHAKKSDMEASWNKTSIFGGGKDKKKV
jgi:hypothetical protein